MLSVHNITFNIPFFNIFFFFVSAGLIFVGYWLVCKEKRRIVFKKKKIFKKNTYHKRQVGPKGKRFEKILISVPTPPKNVFENEKEETWVYQEYEEQQEYVNTGETPTNVLGSKSNPIVLDT